jgi:nitroreductase
LVLELLDTAVWVPNYHMTQPWRFIISHGEGKQRMAEAVRQMKESREPDSSKRQAVGQKFCDKIMAIPMIITVVMEENTNLIVREEDYGSTSCVILELQPARLGAGSWACMGDVSMAAGVGIPGSDGYTSG